MEGGDWCNCHCHIGSVSSLHIPPSFDNPVAAATACNGCRWHHVDPFAVKPNDPRRDPWRGQGDGEE